MQDRRSPSGPSLFCSRADPRASTQVLLTRGPTRSDLALSLAAWLLSFTLCFGTLASAYAQAGLGYGKAEPFNFEQLVERARVLAQKPYQPPYRPAPEVVSKIDYDVHGKIRFKVAQAL